MFYATQCKGGEAFVGVILWCYDHFIGINGKFIAGVELENNIDGLNGIQIKSVKFGDVGHF